MLPTCFRDTVVEVKDGLAILARVDGQPLMIMPSRLVLTADETQNPHWTLYDAWAESYDRAFARRVAWGRGPIPRT